MVTVKELRKMLEEVPDDVEIALCSDKCDIYNNIWEVGMVIRLSSLDMTDDRVILVER